MTDREALRARLREFDTEALQRVLHSADYTDMAIAVARELLEARGVDDNAVQNWRDPDIVKLARPMLSPRSASELHAIAGRRKTVYLVTLWSCVSLLGIAVLLGMWPERTADLEGALQLLWFVAVVSFLFGGALVWRRPLTILVLRPFDHRVSASGLRKLIKRYFRYYGHVYTLADSELSGDPSVLPWRDTFLWGWPGLLVSFRRRVQTEEAVWALHTSIGRRIPRALNWLFSIDKIFKVRASTDWWQRSVQVLANSAALMLLDISRIGQGIAWEVEEINHYGLAHKVIVVTDRANVADALRFVTATWPPESRPFLAVYNDDGVVEQPDALIQHIEGMLLHALHLPANHSMQRTALRAAADAER